eukprot:3409748-Amphidinium_carterae.1
MRWAAATNPATASTGTARFMSSSCVDVDHMCITYLCRTRSGSRMCGGSAGSGGGGRRALA